MPDRVCSYVLQTYLARCASVLRLRPRHFSVSAQAASAHSGVETGVPRKAKFGNWSNGRIYVRNTNVRTYVSQRSTFLHPPCTYP